MNISKPLHFYSKNAISKNFSIIKHNLYYIYLNDYVNVQLSSGLNSGYLYLLQYFVYLSREGPGESVHASQSLIWSISIQISQAGAL